MGSRRSGQGRGQAHRAPSPSWARVRGRGTSPRPHSCWIWRSSQKIGSRVPEPAVRGAGRRLGKGPMPQRLARPGPAPEPPCPAAPDLVRLLPLHLPLGLHVALVPQQQALHPGGGILGAKRSPMSHWAPRMVTTPPTSRSPLTSLMLFIQFWMFSKDFSSVMSYTRMMPWGMADLAMEPGATLLSRCPTVPQVTLQVLSTSQTARPCGAPCGPRGHPHFPCPCLSAPRDPRRPPLLGPRPWPAARLSPWLRGSRQWLSS